MNTGKNWTDKDKERLKTDWKNKSTDETVLSLSRRICGKYKRTYSSVRCILTNWLQDGIVARADIEPEPPAVLTMDIETLPVEGYVWQAYDTNLIKVKKDWCVACWSAKWWGDERVISGVMTAKETETRNDKRICRLLWNLFEEADVIIGQNLKKFDFLKMNTRWWYWGMGKPSSCQTIDTLETARKTFSMTFNNLDYLATYLGIGRKKQTGGFELWENFMAGDKDAMEKMDGYCQNDVVLTERVYDRMKGWVPNHPKWTAYSRANSSEVCPVCLDRNVRRIGFYYAAVKYFKEYRCGSCKAIWHSTKGEK